MRLTVPIHITPVAEPCPAMLRGAVIREAAVTHARMITNATPDSVWMAFAVQHHRVPPIRPVRQAHVYSTTVKLALSMGIALTTIASTTPAAQHHRALQITPVMAVEPVSSMMAEAAAVPQSATAITASMTNAATTPVPTNAKAAKALRRLATTGHAQTSKMIPIQATNVAFIHVMTAALAKATAQQMMIATATAVIIVMSATVA